MLPGWQKLVAPHVKAGRLVAIGVVQEQHADRARLYQQWRQLGWPIFVDSLNLLGHKVVPIPVGIGPNGTVLAPRLRGRGLDAFLDQTDKPVKAHAALKWTKGDKAFFDGEWDRAVKEYGKQARKDPRLRFRLGVALRARFESDARKPGDGQAAVDAWTAALAAVPTQYIWRRRIEQYGPRLEKPYNFYGWIEQARAEITARGETPLPLRIEPRGAELMDRSSVAAGPPEDPDPKDQVPKDDKNRVTIETIVAPSVVKSKGARRARVRVVFDVRNALWNNESQPLSLHVRPPKSASVGEGQFTHGQAQQPETKERRVLEFEVTLAAGATGPVQIPVYALYSVCDAEDGVCLYLRRDFTVSIPTK